MVGTGAVELSREQILGHRRCVGALDRRLPSEPASIRTVASAGLQDSVPRAAVLSLHARVDAVGSGDWAHPELVQVWGPRFSVFVVPRAEVAPFTLGRLPGAGAGRRRAVETADRIERVLAGREMTYRAVGEALGVQPNSLRYAATTGRVMLRWEGSGQPVVWMVDPPDLDEHEARLDLARRYLHVLGPDTIAGYSRWAGIKPREAATTFEALARELVAVSTPIGPGWMLADDVDTANRWTPGPSDAPKPVRLLPSGDPYTLYWGAARNLLVGDPANCVRLWTPRVWPGAIVVGGEVVGTWRRSGTVVDLTLWEPLPTAERDAVEAEATTLPLPGGHSATTVRWLVPSM